MLIFASLSESNIRMNYRYLSCFVEFVIFLSDAVARRHRKVPVDLNNFFSIFSKHKVHITKRI